MRRKQRKQNQRRVRAHYKVTRCNHRDFRNIPTIDPELTWVDQLLRSFNEETPAEWMPAQYQAILEHEIPRKWVVR